VRVAVAVKSKKAEVLLRLAAVGVLLSSIFAFQGGLASIEAGKGDRIDILTGNFLDPFKDNLSGPGWMVAEGLDPRGQTRPDWNVLTRMDVGSVNSFASGNQAPGGQGGGVLVPFRDPAPAFSRNLLLTRDFSNVPIQTEPHIAVDPTDPDHLVVGVIDFNFPTISAYVSFDAGESWEGPFQSPFLRGDRIGGGDPVVAFDRDGNVYMVSISIGLEDFQIANIVAQAQVSSIALSVSQDGGFTWSEPVSTSRSGVTTDLTVDQDGRSRGEISLSFLDKPWIAVGPDPDDPTRDNIYVSYTDFEVIAGILYIDELPTLSVQEVQSTIKSVRSIDSGRVWSEPIKISPTVRDASGETPGPGTEGGAVGLKRVVQGPAPTVTPDGTYYTAWVDSTDDESQKGLAEIYINRSDDGGRTFGEPIRVTVLDEPGFRPRTAFFRFWGSVFPKLTSGENGELYLLYTGRNPAKPSDDGDIWFTRSLDRGEEWSKPVVLGGDRTNSLQFFPDIHMGPDGKLHAMWGDMRDSKEQTKYHIYYTSSDDKGETWGFRSEEFNFESKDTRVTDFPSNPNKAFPNGLFIGDYFAITATAEDVFMVWADSRLGEFGGFNQKVAFSRQQAIPAPEIFINPPAGPGGQEVTIQGFNLQPDLNVFIQSGGVVIANQRTNADGRFSARIFMPVAGSGAQNIRVFDDSGNSATTSFFTEFGFGDIQRTQEQLSDVIGSIAAVPGADDLAQIRDQIAAIDTGDGGTAWWVILLATLGGSALAATVAVIATLQLQARRTTGDGWLRR